MKSALSLFKSVTETFNEIRMVGMQTKRIIDQLTVHIPVHDLITWSTPHNLFIYYAIVHEVQK